LIAESTRHRVFNPCNKYSPFSITLGPDGNIWFTEVGINGSGSGIGRITPGGTITEFTGPASRRHYGWTARRFMVCRGCRRRDCADHDRRSSRAGRDAVVHRDPRRQDRADHHQRRRHRIRRQRAPLMLPWGPTARFGEVYDIANNHRRRHLGPGRTGLAARRVCRQYPDGVHRQLEQRGRLSLSTHAGHGRFRWPCGRHLDERPHRDRDITTVVFNDAPARVRLARPRT
jgi:hypothetical protein